MAPPKPRNQKQRNHQNVNNASNQNGGGNNTNSNNNNGYTQDSHTNLTDAIRQTSEILYQQNLELNRPVQIEMQNTQTMANRVGQDQGQERGQHYYANYNTAQTSSTPVHIPYNQPSAFYHGPSPPNIAQSSQDNGIPPWAASLCQQMINIQTTLNGHTEKWQSVETKIENQNQDLLKMQTQLSEITKIKQNIEFTNTKVKTIQNHVQSIQADVKNCDQTMKQYSDLYDDLVVNNCNVDKRLHAMESKIEAIERKQTQCDQRHDQISDRVTDVQWRGMRENLLFCGIREAENFRTEGEDCEEIVKKFIRDDLEIEDDIQLDRCHRLGRFRRDNPRPRPIIAKFTYFKDKERVKHTGQQKLKESAFWVKDQYPKEMEEKRKSLYAVADEARKIESNRVALVRDKLYINGEMYRPNDQQQQQQQRRSNERQNMTRPFVQNYGNGRNTLQWGRTFYRRNVHNQQADQSPQLSTLSNSNRFQPLTSDTPVNQSRKKKATSPLELENTFKKQHCDSSEDESETGSEQSTILVEADISISDSHTGTQLHTISVGADDTLSVEHTASGSCDQADDANLSRDQTDEAPLSREQGDDTQPPPDRADDISSVANDEA